MTEAIRRALQYNDTSLRALASRYGANAKTGVKIRQQVRQTNDNDQFPSGPQILEELLDLGIDVGRTTVAKDIVRLRRPPSRN